MLCIFHLTPSLHPLPQLLAHLNHFVGGDGASKSMSNRKWSNIQAAHQTRRPWLHTQRHEYNISTLASATASEIRFVGQKRNPNTLMAMSDDDNNADSPCGQIPHTHADIRPTALQMCIIYVHVWYEYEWCIVCKRRVRYTDISHSVLFSLLIFVEIYLCKCRGATGGAENEWAHERIIGVSPAYYIYVQSERSRYKKF